MLAGMLVGASVSPHLFEKSEANCVSLVSEFR